MARELHDAVTQTLFSASMIAEVLPDLMSMNPDEGKRRLEELRQLTRGALAEMRTLLIELRPNSLVQIPLNELIRQLCESLISRAKLPINFSYQGEMAVPSIFPGLSQKGCSSQLAVLFLGFKVNFRHVPFLIHGIGELVPSLIEADEIIVSRCSGSGIFQIHRFLLL